MAAILSRWGQVFNVVLALALHPVSYRRRQSQAPRLAAAFV